MARFLRQSTTATIKIGPAVSPTDGLTAYTSGGFTVKLSSNGGALAARNDATAIAHDADGYYNVEFNATDTATLGRLKAEVAGSAGNYLPFWDDFVVLSQPVYDALFGSAALLTSGTGTDQLSVSSGKVLLQATQTGVTIPTVTTVTNQLTTAQIATGVWQDATAGDFTVSGSIGKSLYTSGNAPGAANGLFVAGSNAPTTVNIAGNITGNIAGSVTGDVQGKVLGGGSGVITGVGAQADLQTIRTQFVTCLAGVTVNANVGTTQPVNFTGTGASALAKCDMVDVAGSAVSASTAQIGVNVVNIGGSASAGAAGKVAVDQAQALASPRDVSAVADGSLTIADAYWGAVAGPFGKESITGTTYVVKTPSTGTQLRSFTLDSSSSPTSRT